MRNSFVAAACVIFAACASAQFRSEHFTTEEISPGVWAVINNDWSAASANAAIIDLGGETLVFDALFTPEAGRDLRLTAERLTGRPVRYLVLSHWHNDHIRGAQEFPGAAIISTARTRELIAEREPPEIAGEKRGVEARLETARQALAAETDGDRRRERLFWVSYYEAMKRSHPQLRLTLPGLTFEKRMVFEGSARRVELIAFAGHTGSDAVAWLPAERIALMGDLHFVNHQPYLPHGDPDLHRQTLRDVKELGPLQVLPGHGPVSGPETLDTLIAFIDDTEARARALRQEGIRELERSKVKVPKEYERWWFGNFYFVNLRHMFNRLGE